VFIFTSPLWLPFAIAGSIKEHYKIGITVWWIEWIEKKIKGKR
jgi:hypothetical protein